MLYNALKGSLGFDHGQGQPFHQYPFGYIHPLKSLKALVELALETLGCWADTKWHTEPSESSLRGLKCRELAVLFVKLCLKESILQIVFFITLPLDSSGKISPPQVVGGIDTSLLDLGAVGRCKT